MSVIQQHHDISALLHAPHVGVDEAGRGCLAGPVVAAAVVFPPCFDAGKHLPGLGDSKQLSEKTRNTLAPLITATALSYGVGLAWPGEVDRCNIVSANYRAMTRAVFRLFLRLGAAWAGLPLLLIDGNLVIREDQWKAAGTTLPGDFFPAGLPGAGRAKPLPPALRHPYFFSSPPRQVAIIKGDGRVPAIAAASVLAKTRRDVLMQTMDGYYPGYGFARHKGYGTKEHSRAIREAGPCPLHRKTFLKKITAGEQQLSFL